MRWIEMIATQLETVAVTGDIIKDCKVLFDLPFKKSVTRSKNKFKLSEYK